MENKMYIGIDPGKKGFICTISVDLIYFEPIPLIGKEVDLNELSNVIRNIKGIAESYQMKIHCVIEDVHAKFGSSAKATFSFGYVCGATEAMLIAHDIPYTKVNPKKWQKEMWEGIPVQKKPSSSGKTMVNDTKLMSLMAAKRLFPEVDLRASNRSKIPHDGKVDSLLLAEYCRRKF